MENEKRTSDCGSSGDLVTLQLKVPASSSVCDAASKTETMNIVHKAYITGNIETKAGRISVIATKLTWRDYCGTLMVRWGIRRNKYRVAPGLYAVGTPSEQSDVFVTANYKLTFDVVRKNLDGMNAWLLVLETKGVNVWCAAGKGNFGTNELVRRIQLTSLKKIVAHRRLIVPQLGATGVAAHQVKKMSGFTVMYGPVLAMDIPAFIAANHKATKEMRRVQFNWFDRAKLIPNEFIYNMRYLLPLFVAISILSGFSLSGYSIERMENSMLPIVRIILAGYLGGIVFTPLLLPYIPVRSFSFKGLIVGGGIAASIAVFGWLGNTHLNMLSSFFFISAFSSFLAMLFTGSSTYTSLAGVKKEMRIAVPIQIASVALAAVFVLLQFIFRGWS